MTKQSPQRDAEEAENGQTQRHRMKQVDKCQTAARCSQIVMCGRLHQICKHGPNTKRLHTKNQKGQERE